MIVFNADFPKTCKECPIRAKIGCDLSYTREGILEHFIHPDCPFESAEPVNPAEAAGGGGYEVAEMICLKCGYRFIDARPVGLLLKDMVCPRCNHQGFIIETGEYMTDEN